MTNPPLVEAPAGVVPLDACIARGEYARKGAPFHVLNLRFDPFCGRTVCGEDEPYTGGEPLCGNCLRVIARLHPTGMTLSQDV